MTWIFIFSIGTAVLAILSSILQQIEKLETTKINLKKEEELKDVYKKLSEKSDTIISSADKIKELQDKVIDLQKNNLSELTGGDSYPFFTLMPAGNASMIFLELSNPGRHAIDNLRVCIVYKWNDYSSDIRKEMRLLNMNIPGAFRWEKSMPTIKMRGKVINDEKFEVLMPGQQSLFHLPFTGDQYLEYNIYCSSNRQAWVVLVRLFKKNVSKIDAPLVFEAAFKILKVEKDQFIELFKTPPPYKDMPVDKNGELKWDIY